MAFYELAFVVLISGCVLLTWHQYHIRGNEETSEKTRLYNGPVNPNIKDEASRFTKNFLAVYMLVMGADWLQGPYIYTLYKDELRFDERTVAFLFTTGFLSGAVSGYFVGSLADRFGRRLACLVFCVTYSLSCLSVLLVRSLPVLFLGRVLGGLSTSLMYSAFESWMVTEFHRRELDTASSSGGGVTGGGLSGMYGTMTTVNGVVAILAGVGSEWLVGATHSKRTPFLASTVLFAAAFALIWSSWSENYGDCGAEESSPALSSFTSLSPSSITDDDNKEASESTVDVDEEIGQQRPVAAQKRSALQIVMTDPRIPILGLASCFFEGSMYLFVFFWTPFLKAAHAYSHANRPPPSTVSGSPAPYLSASRFSLSPAASALPFGLIFASFMASIMIGSLVFNLVVSTHQLISHARLLTIIFATASMSMLLPLLVRDERVVFWSFCVFEACVGMYWPSVGYLKGRIVEDGVRARVYGLLRVPLNVFVVAALAMTREGDACRETVFLCCGGLLVVTSGVFHRMLSD